MPSVKIENCWIRDNGGWGLNVTWNDGHATGIYPFESLHDWPAAGTPFPATSPTRMPSFAGDGGVTPADGGRREQGV